jgi:hypothetical protein
VDWASAPAVQETNVQSAICEPAPGSELEGPLDEIEVPAPPAAYVPLQPGAPSLLQQLLACVRAPARLRCLGRVRRGAGMPSLKARLGGRQTIGRPLKLRP